jgi:hypothetical protein
MATKPPQVIGGVDTHRDLHVAAAIDPVGRPLGHRSFPATPAGYRALLAWLRGLGQLQRVAWGEPAPMALVCCATCTRQR